MHILVASCKVLHYIYGHCNRHIWHNFGAGKLTEVSSEFWSQVMGPSCELFDGWLSSDSKNTLCPASKAKGTRLCVSVKGLSMSSYSPLWDVEMLHGVTRGNGPRLTGGPQLRGWRSIKSKCPPSWSFHCSAFCCVEEAYIWPWPYQPYFISLSITIIHLV